MGHNEIPCLITAAERAFEIRSCAMASQRADDIAIHREIVRKSIDFNEILSTCDHDHELLEVADKAIRTADPVCIGMVIGAITSNYVDRIAHARAYASYEGPSDLEAALSAFSQWEGVMKRVTIAQGGKA